MTKFTTTFNRFKRRLHSFFPRVVPSRSEGATLSVFPGSDLLSKTRFSELFSRLQNTIGRPGRTLKVESLKKFTPLLLIPLLALTVYFVLRLIAIPRAPTLRPGSGDSLYIASNDIYTASIGTKIGGSNISFSVGDSNTSFTLAGSAKVKATKNGKSVVFPSVLPDTDLRYTTTTNGIKEELIIKQYNKNIKNTYIFDLVLSPNLVPKQIVGGFIDPTFRDSAGQYQFHFDKPFAVDAKGSRTNDVILQIMNDKQLPDKYSLKLVVDAKWLSDPSRAYPIVIDPTIVHDTTAEFATGYFDRVKDIGSGSSPFLESYYQELPTDEHTVGLWHMNEASGNALDSSGNSFSAIQTSVTTNTTTHILGSASKTMNGSSSIFTVADNDQLDPVAITLEGWIKPNVIQYGNFFNKGGNLGYRFRINSDGTLTFFDRGGTNSITSVGVLQSGRWYHVAATGDSSGLKIYIDGKLASSNSTAYGSPNTALALTFGDTGGAEFFSGDIDEFRLSNIARSPEEIKANASRRPSAVYTSPVLDLEGASSLLTGWNPLTWTELGVSTGDGETIKDATGLVAQWNFNETSGTTADNAEGTATLDGTLTGFASTASQDQVVSTGWTANNKRWGAGALMFDGTDDYVSTANNSSLNPINITLETWFKPTTLVSSNIIEKRNAANNEINYLLQLGANGTVRFVSGLTSGFKFDYYTSPITANNWTYIVATFDGTTAKTYINGKLNASANYTGNLSTTTDNSFFIGKHGTLSSGYISGTIDSTRLYSRALTSAEIMSNYQSGNVELQTRVGDTTTPDDGSWDAWTPTSGEAQLDTFDLNTSATSVYTVKVADSGTNQTWTKKNNTTPTTSDTTGTDGRLPIGTSGTGDDGGILSPLVIKDGSTYKMWYPGHDGTSYRIYYATSPDGLTWTKYNNAIPTASDTSSTNGRIPLGTAGKGDSFYAQSPTVIKDGSTYKMWYQGQDTSNYNRIYYATSSDGLTWTKYDNTIPSASDTSSTNGRIPLGTAGKGDSNGVGLPTVIKDGSTYKMWYSGSNGTAWRIYYATSSDGLTWTKYDNTIPTISDKTSTNGRLPIGNSGTADSLHAYGPRVIKDGDVYKMWYSAHMGTVRVGYATSPDGLTWTKYSNAIEAISDTTGTNGRLPIGNTGTGDQTHSYGPTVIKDNGVYRMWYSGYNGSSWMVYSATMTPTPISESTDSNIKIEGSASQKFVVGQSQVDSNLVGLWHLDETSGTGNYLKDATGNFNHATPTSTTVTRGISGKAHSFNGTSSVATIIANSAFNFTGDYTLEAWIKPTTTGVLQGIMGKNSANGWGLNLNSTNKINFGMHSCSNFDGTTTIYPNQWYHVVGVYQSTGSKIYVNGTLDASGTLTGGNCGADGSDVVIGQYRNTSANNFYGTIDEVRISKSARSAEEIAETYRLGHDHYFNKTISSTDLSGQSSLPFYLAADRPGTYLSTIIGESAFANYQPDSSTVGLWHLDELSGTGSYIKDAGTFANNATPTGTTSLAGKIGRSRYFNGTSDITSITNSDSVNINGSGSQATIDLWINPSTLTPTWQTLLYKHNGATDCIEAGCSDRQYAIWLNTAGYIYLNATSVNNIGVTLTAIASPAGTITIGKWHHLVAVIDSVNGFMKLYINGQEVSSGAFSTTGIRSGDGPVYLAGAAGSANYNGFLDEVRVSKVARTSDQIRQSYEIGLRTHPITIDFGAVLDSDDLIANSGDLGFTVDATYYGLDQQGSMIFPGDKIIVQENVSGTEYLSQGTVTTVSASTGAITIASWDSGSTFPPSGFTVNASVFKWQREYWNVTSGSLDTHLDAITNLTLHLTESSEGRTIYLDDLRSNSGNLTTPLGSTITSSTGSRYFQYRTILTSYDEAVTPQISTVNLDYTLNDSPLVPTLSTPLDTSTGVSITPTLTTVTTDPDSDYLRYKIELCTDLSMTTSCQTFDQTSSQTGWTGQNAQTSTAYTSGTPSSYTLQTPLAISTLYYWRSYAIDPAGVNLWTSTQTPFSFTAGAPPTTPILGLPSNGAINQSLTPALHATATDTDSDYLRYKIELCTDLSMTTSCQTFDQTSSQTGWTGQNTETSTAYTSGTEATYTLTTNLVPYTEYFWRASAIDPGGFNTWSSPSTINSFTTRKLNEGFTCLLHETPDDTSLTITWNDRETNENSYKLERSVDGAAFTLFQTLAANSTSYQDTSILSGHTYGYRIAPFITTGSIYGDWCTTATLDFQNSTFNFSGLNFNGLKIN